MNVKSSTLLSGLVAIGIYLSLFGLLIYYFNSYHQKKSIHYVKKNENHIRITMHTPTHKEQNTAHKEAPKKTLPPKKKIKQKPKKKRVPKKINRRKKIIKEKIVKKTKPKKIKKPPKKRVIKKRNKPKDLFANLKTNKKPATSKIKQKHTQKRDKSASDLLQETQKIQKQRDSGIENAYFALIEQKLKGWPAQSEYAGEKAKVWIKVEPSGSFVFKVISASSNIDFNKGLVAYLKQLQQFGFGKHRAKRAYEINVEFIATQ